MSKINNKIKALYIIGVFSLIIGLIIYLIFREQTYISKSLSKFFPLKRVREVLKNFNINFVKFYLPDYLWALSLNCGLNIIFKPRRIGSVICAVTVFIIGILYEIFQYLGLIIGTGDIIDIILYLLAGITVNIINFKGE